MSTKKKATAKQRPAKRSATKRKTAKKPGTKKPAAKKKLATKAAPNQAKAPKANGPTTGTTIERTFKGTKHTVQVTANGYAYKGTEYRSLTAIAKAITGYPSISGPRFFGTDEATTAKSGAK